jgi:hypothetical protein
MSEWTLDQVAHTATIRERNIRLGRARNAPMSITETRVALVAFEIGISDRQFEAFYYVNRKGAKKRHFNTEAFAEKYGIDIRWLRRGELSGHPRGLCKKSRKTTRRRPVQPQEGGAA